MTLQAMANIADADDDLVQRARHEAEALGRLYDRHYAGVFRYCLHRLYLREAAEDATSEVFLAVARRIRRFAGRSEEDFRNWLFAIATRQVAAYLRSRSRRAALLEAAARERRLHAADPPDPAAAVDWPLLYQAIAALAEREQAILTLRCFEGWPFERIGAALSIEPATARVALHRALGKLRERLGGSFGPA